MKSTHPLVSSAAQVGLSAAMMLPIAAVADRFWVLPLPSGAALAATLALGLVSTALAYVIFFRVMASAGSNNVMLVTLMIPPSAIALGVLVLGETLSPRQIAGALIIGSGLLVTDGRLTARAAAGLAAMRSRHMR